MCLISGGCSSSPSSSVEDLGDMRTATGRGGMMGSADEGTEAFLVGDRLLLLSLVLGRCGEGDGEGDVEEAEVHGLRAILRRVSATDRPGVFGRPTTSEGCVLSPRTDPFGEASSADTVTLGAESFFLIFLDAFRNTCLFAE